MGAFFTNVMVSTRGQDPQEARERALEAVSAWVRSKGYVEAQPDQAADRAVMLGPVEGQPWLAVYDQATEDQDPRVLEELASVLSLAAGAQGTAVGVLVHDSDVLYLELLQGGRVLDRYSSDPDYFGKVSSAERKALSGVPERWADVVAPEHSVEQLRAVWSEQCLFAEETLSKTAELLGWNQTRVSLGFNSLSLEQHGLIALRFRLASRPDHESKRSGPPVFTPAGFTPQIELSVGDVSPIVTWVMNTGGAAQGLSLVVWGEAIDQELVRPETVTFSIGLQQKRQSYSAPFKPSESPQGQLYVASAPELQIPPGLAHMTSLHDAESGQVRQAVNAWFETQIHASIETRVLQVGHGSLMVGYVPTANPTQGQTSHTMHVRALPAPRRPLKSPPNTESHLLRALETPDTLFILAALGADRTTVAEVVAELMERWVQIAFPSGEGSMTTTLMAADPKSRPKVGQLKIAGLQKAKRWKEIRAALSTCRGFSAVHRLAAEERSVEPTRQGHGFSLATSLYPWDDPKDPWVPQFGLWYDIKGVDAARRHEVTQELRTLTEEALLRCEGYQALLGAWSWTPEFSADTTAYELACGVHGQCTTRQSWCQRYLRGVTGQTLWLGAELQAHLQSHEGLRRIAELTQMGQLLRIDLRRESDIGALEKALDPVLPDSHDWMQRVTGVTGGGKTG